jgi:hypothetical protein
MVIHDLRNPASSIQQGLEIVDKTILSNFETVVKNASKSMKRYLFDRNQVDR